MERLTHEADFGLEDWEETLFFVKSDPNGAYNIIDIAKYQGEPEFDEILKNVALRLSSIENILGDDYDLDRLREIAEADRDGRCVVLPCKFGDTVYSIRHERVPDDEYRMSFHTEMRIISQKFGLNHADCIGKTVFLTREEAEAALKAREQNE